MTIAQQTVLTGIKPTGRFHLGNYFGMINPALEAMAHNKGEDNYLFLADIHSISSVMDAKAMREFTYEGAATLLACGLDPNEVCLFRESDIREISELSAYLMHVTPKGLMNRAHAYKAIVQDRPKDDEIDVGVSMGLYTYPILMAADILAFGSTIVPVGSDQVQHVEFARDIAGYFNNAFGQTFTIPRHQVRPEVAIVPGLDGRKMSKSYGNHIPVFDDAKAITAAVKRIVTDSLRPEEAKDPETNNIYLIYKAMATKAESAAFADRFRASGSEGMGYGEAKQILADKIIGHFAEARPKYEYYMAHKSELDEILAAGAARARPKAQAGIEKVRTAIGFI